jgi:hypothetical protein
LTRRRPSAPPRPSPHPPPPPPYARARPPQDRALLELIDDNCQMSANGERRLKVDWEVSGGSWRAPLALPPASLLPPSPLYLPTLQAVQQGLASLNVPEHSLAALKAHASRVRAAAEE